MSEHPDRRRREDTLEELLAHGSRNFRRYRRRAITGYILLVLFGVVGFAYGFQKIDDSRRETVRLTCEESNARHDKTIRRLDELAAKAPDSAGARARRDGTVALIDTLSPKRDCDKRADQLVSPTQ